jgi:hypothetical protein
MSELDAKDGKLVSQTENTSILSTVISVTLRIYTNKESILIIIILNHLKLIL